LDRRRGTCTDESERRTTRQLALSGQISRAASGCCNCPRGTGNRGDHVGRILHRDIVLCWCYTSLQYSNAAAPLPWLDLAGHPLAARTMEGPITARPGFALLLYTHLLSETSNKQTMLRARLLRKSFKHAVPPQSKFILTSRARLVDGHINTTVADGGNYARSLATSSSTTTTNTDSTFLKSQASHGYKFSNRLHASRFLWTCLVSLGLLAAYTASKPSLLAEEAQDKPAFTKDQVGIVCIIGRSCSRMQSA
jgi:hypothetical protein